MSRIAVSKKTRFEVFKRDKFSCQYCGAHPPDALLECDHIVPVAEGGGNNEDNLLTACFDCNRGKGAKQLSSAPMSLAGKAKEVAEREDQLAGYRCVIESKLSRIEDDLWSVAETLSPGSAKTGMRRDWLRSIKMFNERLDLHEVVDAADIAMSKFPNFERKRFRYFCGVCWNKIKRGGE